MQKSEAVGSIRCVAHIAHRNYMVQPVVDFERMAEEDEEARDAELDAQPPPPRLFAFGAAERERSPTPPPRSAADELDELRQRVEGDASEAEVSDASVASLEQRMQFAFAEPSPRLSRKRKRGAPRGRAKRPRPFREEKAADDEGGQLREELDRLPRPAVAPEAGVVADENDEPEAWPADVVDWDAVDEAEPERNPDPNWCAFCRHTQRMIDVGDNNPYIPDIIKHAEDNWVHVEPVELMRQLQDRYNDTVRWSIEQADQRLPWHKKTIFAHFTRHTKGTRIKYEAESEAIDEMVFVMMREELFVKNKKTGRKNVNLKKLPQFFKLLAQQERFDKTLKTLRPHNVL